MNSSKWKLVVMAALIFVMLTASHKIVFAQTPSSRGITLV